MIPICFQSVKRVQLDLERSSEKCSSVLVVLRVVLRVVIVGVVVRIAALIVRVRRPVCADASRCYWG